MNNCGRVVVVAALAGLACAGCRNNGDRGPYNGEDWGSAPAPQGRSLYQRLGGEESIRAVVNDLTERASQNPRVNFTRRGMPTQWDATPENVEHFKRAMTDFLVEKSGGPARYQGKDMKTTHRGMRISEDEFDALLADADASMRQFRVPDPERTEVLALLDHYRGDIVEAR